MAQWLSGLERRPVTAEVEGSSPFWVVIWDLSSAGRASALQAEGHRFEPCRSHMPMWLNWQSSWFVISRLSVRVRSSAFFFCKKEYCFIMDGFPSGQRGQTVNLLQIASVVRIHLHPLLIRYIFQLDAYNIISLKVNIAGWSSLEARRAHNPKVIGSNPVPATLNWIFILK